LINFVYRERQADTKRSSAFNIWLHIHQYTIVQIFFVLVLCHTTIQYFLDEKHCVVAAIHDYVLNST